MNEHDVGAALELIGSGYKQHNVRAPDGKEFLRVEHWDTYMPVPPKDQWQNDNGMF